MTSVSGSESLDSASWNMLQNVMQTVRKPLGAVTLPLSWNWQDQAVARFFADYILPSDVFTDNLQFLPRLCGSSSSCHHLKEALQAVAFASQGNQLGLKWMTTEGSLAYGRALPLIADVLQNQSREDSTLAAIFLLGLYEVCLFSALSPFLFKECRS
jgi:hypothetical protein